MPESQKIRKGGLDQYVPEHLKIKNDKLDQYGAERFGRLILPQSEKCGNKRVN